ncbi:MAG: hypothetical protein AB1449_11470 [Chloroflexota bacterium]
MLPELKLVARTVGALTAAGALVGVVVGALTSNYLLWVGVLAGLGLLLGLAMAYGLLPES